MAGEDPTEKAKQSLMQRAKAWGGKDPACNDYMICDEFKNPI
jgi:hypothetical protein